LRPVEFNFGAFCKLFEIKRGINRTKREAVWFGEIVKLVRGDESGRSRDVLNNDVRISRNVFGQKVREQTRIQIVNIAGFSADNNGNGFTLIERGLCRELKAAEQSK